MDEFGRNPFVMTILQTTTHRKGYNLLDESRGGAQDGGER